MRYLILSDRNDNGDRKHQIGIYLESKSPESLKLIINER